MFALLLTNLCDFRVICVAKVSGYTASLHTLFIRSEEPHQFWFALSAGIKAIKLYAWEQSFKERILSLRHLELTQIRRLAYLELIDSLVFGSTPILIALSAFAVYTAQGYPLTPAVAFPALALFNLLRFPITMLPCYLMDCVEAWVALGRMQCFMQVSCLCLHHVCCMHVLNNTKWVDQISANAKMCHYWFKWPIWHSYLSTVTGCLYSLN